MEARVTKVLTCRHRQHGAATRALDELATGSESAAICESQPIILAPGPLRGGFSPYAIHGRLWPLATQVALERCENALPVVLAGSFAAEPAVEELFQADCEDDTRHLYPHREAERVELSDGLP